LLRGLGLDVNTAFSLSRRNVSRTLALWLGLAALLVQAMAPLCLAGFMSVAAPGASSIILCTAHGFETIQIGADGKPLPATPAQDQQGANCPLCSAMHAASAFMPPTLALANTPLSVTAARMSFVSVPVPSRKFSFAYVTRGPPSLA
jgi:hypothetical protein